MAKPKSAWSDPVWSKVISAVIIAAGAAVGAYFLKWWPSVGRAGMSAWRFLVATTPIWNWLLGVGAIWVILTLIEARRASLSAKKKVAAPPYTEDEFFGVRWRWRYAGHEVIGLHCLCLRCGLQVYFGDASCFDAVPRVGSRCEDCGNVVGLHDGNYDMLENHVIRLIHRNLRDAGRKAEGRSA
jgi:hypothetical protein